MRRWILLGGLLLCGLFLIRGHIFNAVLPGFESAKREHLDARFRKKVQFVLESLEREGHAPRVASTYRSPARQDAYFKLGKLAQRLGSAPWTNAQGAQSCHNAGRAQPAALAVDIVPPKGMSVPQKARFYKALGRIAEARGLRWGGRWQQKNVTWARYGIGWDPAHIQSRRCRH